MRYEKKKGPSGHSDLDGGPGARPVPRDGDADGRLRETKKKKQTLKPREKKSEDFAQLGLGSGKADHHTHPAREIGHFSQMTGRKNRL